MTATDLVAIYAALVATAGLAWQAYTWVRTRQSRVDVGLVVAVIPGTGPGGSAMPCAMVTVINHSDHEVNVVSVRIDVANKSGARQDCHLAPHGATTIPGKIASRDSGHSWLPLVDTDKQGVDWTAPAVARIRLATGQSHASKPIRLVRPEGQPV